MSPFSGFISGKTEPTPIPAAFFTDLLPEIDDLAELRVTLYAFWHLELQEDEIRYLLLDDFLSDKGFISLFGTTDEQKKRGVQTALDRAVRRGTFLVSKASETDYYFLNSEIGRTSLQALTKAGWQPDPMSRPHLSLEAKKPNIFLLYEQNIGPLTPILSETLQEAENEYPYSWIEDAVKIAVTKNARNWRFVEAVLRNWKEKGRDEKDQRASKENRKRDSEGEFAEYINH